MALFWKRMQSEWPIYIARYIRHTFYLWDKYHLFTYNDPFYPRDEWALRTINWISIALSFIGLTWYIRQDVKRWREPLVLFTLLMFFYITLLFPLMSNESRHSLTFYSLLYLWAGVGVHTIITKTSRRYVGINDAINYSPPAGGSQTASRQLSNKNRK